MKLAILALGVTVGVIIALSLVWKREPEYEPFEEPGGGW